VLSQYGFFFALIAGVVLAGILPAPCPPPIRNCWPPSSVSRNLWRKPLASSCRQSEHCGARVTVVVISVIAVFIALNRTVRFPHRFLRLGGLRRGLRAGGAACAVLARSNQWGALCGMLAARDGFRVEVPA
jgi:hypothetical protein